MTYRTTGRVKGNRVVIALPPYFLENKEVTIIVDDALDVRSEKMNLLRKAAQDPMFLADIREIQEDFEDIDPDTE
jgi:hypothetical protein